MFWQGDSLDHKPKVTTVTLYCIPFQMAYVLLTISWYIREGNGTPLQYSCLENPLDGGAWWAALHGVAKSWARLSDFTFTFHFHALEKEMATHSSVLAWRIPGTEEPSGLPSMGSHRVGHDWSDLAAAAAVCSILHKEEEKLDYIWRPVIEISFCHQIRDLTKLQKYTI